MDTKKKSNTQLAKEARELGKRIFTGNVHDECQTNLFYTHNRQCVHCKDEREANNPPVQSRSPQSRIMTPEARAMYLGGASIDKIVKELRISKYTLRTHLQAEGILRSSGKRKGSTNKKDRRNKPSYNDLREQEESKYFTSSCDILSKAFKAPSLNTENVDADGHLSH